MNIRELLAVPATIFKENLSEHGACENFFLFVLLISEKH